jgi:hypothetical protein
VVTAADAGRDGAGKSSDGSWAEWLNPMDAMVDRVYERILKSDADSEAAQQAGKPADVEVSGGGLCGPCRCARS